MLKYKRNEKRGAVLKKLVLKTTAITLACALGILAILYGIFALFITRPLANLFDKLGMYNASIHYYERGYNKSKSIDDLYLLCLKLDAKEDSVKVEHYSKILIEDTEFISYSKTKDEDKNGITTEEYVEGKYARAVYKNNDIDKTISAVMLCLNNGYNPIAGQNSTTCYPEYNAFLMLLTDETIDWENKHEDLQKIKNKIEAIYAGESIFSLTEVEKNYATRDLAIIDEILA